MDLLGSLQPGDIKGQMIWCYYEEHNPSEKIINLVTDFKGVLVPVPDFDLLMVLLGERMQVGLLDEEIGLRAEKRTQQYRERIQRLDTVKHPTVTKALAATLTRSGGWWAWYQKASAEIDLDRRETVFRQGIQHCPQSAELHHNFANFLRRDRKNHDEAERFYRKAVEINPKNDAVACNLATFLWQVRGNNHEAERLYCKAIQLNMGDADIMGNYGGFLLSRGDLDRATEALRQARSLNGDRKTQLSAELALYGAILARAKHQDDTVQIQELKSLLAEGFVRGVWSFDAVLAFAKQRLSPEDHGLFSAIAAGILDPSKVPYIDQLLRHRRISKILPGTTKKSARRPSPLKRVVAKTAKKPSSSEPTTTAELSESKAPPQT
jgi:Tfp pilus assembly protein PilF